MKMPRTLFLFFMLIALLHASEREKAVCGAFFEPFVFWMWHSMTPEPDRTKVAGAEFVQSIEFKAGDGKILRGYRQLANNGHIKLHVKGYVLVAMGNTMASDEMITALDALCKGGYDVYVFDYRGYGNSEGNRRINAFIEDYKEIAKSLNEKYKRKLLYGISLGGAVMMNVIGSGVPFDAAVIDSAPSALSPFGCPREIDPVANLPKDAGRILIVTAENDSVLPPSITAPLRDAAQSRGAKVFHSDEFDHPFADKSIEVHNRRMKLILDHLDGR